METPREVRHASEVAKNSKVTWKYLIDNPHLRYEQCGGANPNPNSSDRDLRAKKRDEDRKEIQLIEVKRKENWILIQAQRQKEKEDKTMIVEKQIDCFREKAKEDEILIAENQKKKEKEEEESEKKYQEARKKILKKKHKSNEEYIFTLHAYEMEQRENADRKAESSVKEEEAKDLTKLTAVELLEKFGKIKYVVPKVDRNPSHCYKIIITTEGNGIPNVIIYSGCIPEARRFYNPFSLNWEDHHKSGISKIVTDFGY